MNPLIWISCTKMQIDISVKSQSCTAIRRNQNSYRTRNVWKNRWKATVRHGSTRLVFGETDSLLNEYLAKTCLVKYHLARFLWPIIQNIKLNFNSHETPQERRNLTWHGRRAVKF